MAKPFTNHDCDIYLQYADMLANNFTRKVDDMPRTGYRGAIKYGIETNRNYQVMKFGLTTPVGRSIIRFGLGFI